MMTEKEIERYEKLEAQLQQVGKELGTTEPQ